MWSQWLLTSLSYPSSILLFSLLWVSASENRKYISTDHFAAKVMRSVVSVFSTISFEPADLELDVWLLYGYHQSSSQIESQGYKSRSSLGFGFRKGKVAFVVTRSVWHRSSIGGGFSSWRWELEKTRWQTFRQQRVRKNYCFDRQW